MAFWESTCNAVFGLLISMAAVVVLRASGQWVDASPVSIAVLFFALSFARSYVLRVTFRALELRERQ